jgi:hypothetical protein
MSVQLVVGVIICGVVMLWLMTLVTVTLIGRTIHIPRGQYGIIRFVCTMAAGFGGGLFANGLSVAAKGSVSNSLELGATGVGAGGFALLILLTFPKGDKQPPMPDIFKGHVPAGWTFEQAARWLAQKGEGTLDLSQFAATELDAKFASDCPLPGPSILVAFRQLSANAPAQVRKFAVTFDETISEYKLLPQ